MSSMFGVLGIGAVMYCVAIVVVNIMANYKHDISPKITRLSYACSILICVAVSSTTLSHFIPTISGYCLCRPFYSTSLSLYVIAMFLIKFIYLERVKIFNEEPILSSKTMKIYISVLTVLLLLSMIICVFTMVFHGHGECSDITEEYVCYNYVDLINIYAIFVLICVDTILFAIFCYKWHDIVSLMKRAETDHKIPSQVIRMFIIQLILTVIAMISCMIDGVINYIYLNDPMSSDFLSMVFIFDCVIVTSCNFGLLKYSQILVIRIVKTLCCCNNNKQTVTTEFNGHKRNFDGVRKSEIPNGSTSIASNKTFPSPISSMTHCSNKAMPSPISSILNDYGDISNISPIPSTMDPVSTSMISISTTTNSPISYGKTSTRVCSVGTIQESMEIDGEIGADPDIADIQIIIKM